MSGRVRGVRRVRSGVAGCERPGGGTDPGSPGLGGFPSFGGCDCEHRPPLGSEGTEKKKKRKKKLLKRC